MSDERAEDQVDISPDSDEWDDECDCYCDSCFYYPEDSDD